jgi:hypothetical protein
MDLLQNVNAGMRVTSLIVHVSVAFTPERGEGVDAGDPFPPKGARVDHPIEVNHPREDFSFLGALEASAEEPGWPGYPAFKSLVVEGTASHSG